MYRLSDGVRATHNQDGATILAIHTGKVLRLNTTGSLVFRQLQEGAIESQIVEAISERFGLPLRVATADVCEFLEALERLGLILDRVQETSAQEMRSENVIREGHN